MAIQGSYQAMLDYARRMGQAGTINPVSVGGFGTGATYEFTPTGGQSRGGLGSLQQRSSLVDQYQKMAEEAKAANLSREKEIRGIYSDILNKISGSESSLRASGLADIERQAARLTGQETQSMISSGLYGTTTAAAIPRNVAASYTQPSRLKLEDLLATRKREAQLGLAGFIERIENAYPDYNALFQAQIAANQ